MRFSIGAQLPPSITTLTITTYQLLSIFNFLYYYILISFLKSQIRSSGPAGQQSTFGNI